jgi:phage baseplate assembly protein W
MGWIGSPFAITPFGAGAPANNAAPPVVPDLTAAFVDPVARDYRLTPDAETARMPSVRQQMLLALTTIYGSSTAAPTFGVNLPKKIDENIGRACKIAVASATAHITRAGRARINDVTTEQVNMGLLRITVSYTDLVDGGNRQLSIGAPGAASGGSGSASSSGTLFFFGDTLTDGGSELTF